LSEADYNRVEIIDKKTSRICVATYAGCCISIALLITIFTLLQAAPPNKYLVIPMFSVVIIIGILIYYYEKKLGTKLLKFNISDENIEILIPPNPWFKISWSDITGIFVGIIIKHTKFTPEYTDSVYPVITFVGKGKLDRKFQLRKFHSSYKREILTLIEEYALRLNKRFSGLPSMKDI